MNKYNAKKVIVTVDGTLFEEAIVKRYKLEIVGTRFDSKAEGEYYQQLIPLLKDGTLERIEFQPAYVLQESPKITYKADFLLIFSNGEQIVVDVKGVETATFRLKRKLFKTKYPNLTLQIIKKHRGMWMTDEDIKKEKAAHRKAVKQLLQRADGGVRNGRI